MAARSPVDVVVAGAGPAGLAAAAFAARAGLSTVVLDRAAGPPDKACGEGLMPAGLRVLEDLGARDLVGPDDCSPIEGIRWVEEDGRAVAGRLPGGGGLGVRRTALASALAAVAGRSGAEVRWGTAVSGFERRPGAVEVRTEAGTLEARLLVAADGLHSALRRQAGLDGPAAPRERFGIRRHFRIEPWSRYVEVHLAAGAEAFATPAGSERVGVAILWEKGTARVPSFEGLLGRFPSLAGRLAGARADSEVRGAGPLARSVRSRVSDRLVLLGDAGGYVDAITGEGLSMALVMARRLGAALPGALAAGADRRSLAAYDEAASREYRRYALVCRSVLGLARRPRLRRQVLALLRLAPGLLDRIVAGALA